MSNLLSLTESPQKIKQIKERSIQVIVGKTGYGKSFYVKNEIIAKQKRIIIFDLQNEYTKEFDFDDSRYTRIYDVEDLRYFLTEIEDKPFKVILVFGWDNFEDYEFALRLAFIAENLTIVIEEVWNFCNSKYINPDLQNLIRIGRHKSISVVAISQRFGDLHLIMRNNLDKLIVFNLSAPNDIKYLRECAYVGDDADKIPLLKRYERLIFENK